MFFKCVVPSNVCVIYLPVLHSRKTTIAFGVTQKFQSTLTRI